MAPAGHISGQLMMNPAAGAYPLFAHRIVAAGFAHKTVKLARIPHSPAMHFAIRLAVENLKTRAGRTRQIAGCAGNTTVGNTTPKIVRHFIVEKKLRGGLNQFEIVSSEGVNTPAKAPNFPVVLLEGMSAGCAILATDVGGNREVLGDAGIVVPLDDPGSSRAELERLLDDDDLRHDLGERARRRVCERFSWSVVASRYESVLENLRGSA